MSSSTKSNKLMGALDRAYRYFPYGFDGIQYHMGWVSGPTFAAKVDGSTGTFAQLGIYKQDPQWKENLQSLITGIEQATEDVNIDALKHDPKCTARAIYPSNGSTDQYPMELPYPLYQVSKYLGVDSWKRSGIVVYGYQGKECVFMSAARYMYVSEDEK